MTIAPFINLALINGHGWTENNGSSEEELISDDSAVAESDSDED